MTKETEREVLSDAVKPLVYDLTISTQVDDGEFTGEETISVEIRKEGVREIELNARELVIQEAIVCRGTESWKAKVTYSESTHRVLFDFETDLPKGNATLWVRFKGTLMHNMCGFYRSSYKDETGCERYLASTQFEPVDARRAFPCWDEPAVKARFNITLKIPRRFEGLSNMDIKEERIENDMKVVSFHTTPIMSTYLVAMVVCDFGHVEQMTKDQVRVRVYTQKACIHQADFALQCAVKTLEWYATYFDIAYPLPKLDMIAIPDFAAGAMENWGLVTYRQVSLLYDRDHSTTKVMQHIAYIIAHELAHQWFGNLVTMEWWTHLWLNEGFATWVGWRAVDYLFPEWHIWTHFITSETNRGLELDSLKSSHPIEVDIMRASEIDEIFDAISYAKGACVIRMLVSFLTEEGFQTGVRAYLKTYQYSNAQTQDLWNSLEKATGKPVRTMMEAWTRQMGYPVIHVELLKDSSEFKVTQNRYLRDGTLSPEDDRTLWMVPLAPYNDNLPKKDGVAEGNASSHLLVNRKDVFRIPSSSSSSPSSGLMSTHQMSSPGYLKLNYGQHGFYRVCYSTEDLASLGQCIKLQRVPAIDRIGLLNDTFELAASGHMSTVDALNLARCFQREEDYMVCAELAASLAELRSVWFEDSESTVERLRVFTRDLFAPLAHRLGFEFEADDSDLKKLLRTLVIGVAGKAGDSKIIEESQRRFWKFVRDRDEKALHPNLRGVVYAIVLKFGDEKVYEAVERIYLETTIIDQKLAALGALGSTENRMLIERALEYAISPQVRSQDIMYVFGSVAANPKGRRLLWQFVQDNWQSLYERYGEGSFLLSRIVGMSCNAFSSDEMAKHIEEFFRDKITDQIRRCVAQSIEKVRNNAHWFSRDRTKVSEWLATFVEI